MWKVWFKEHNISCRNNKQLHQTHHKIFGGRVDIMQKQEQPQQQLHSPSNPLFTSLTLNIVQTPVTLILNT